MLTGILAALLAAIDLCVKHWARSQLLPGSIVTLVPGFLQLHLTTNTGAAFGLGRHHSWLVTSLAVTIFLALCWLSWQRRHLLLDSLGYGFILGGALGNLAERFTLHQVTDYIEFACFSFPIFNLADVFIDFGVGFILLSQLWKSRKSANARGY